MAQAYRRLGCADVVVVEGAGRLLAREEPFAGEELRDAFAAEGITVVTGARMIAARRQGGDGPVVVSLQDGREFTGDEILVAVGRRPATAGIGLDTVGLEPGRPVRVDGQLRAVGAAGDWLYAIGDCNGLAPLTHMGKYHARVAAAAILGREVTDVASHGIVPRVTFTDPQVCAVGPTEAEARDAGLNVTVVRTPTGHVAGAYTQGVEFRGTSQLDHPRLIVDVRLMIRVAERRAGHVLVQVPIKIAIVGCQHVRQFSVHPQILRSVGVPRLIGLAIT